MSIYFIRHGRTASSGTGLLGGDEELTDDGRNDAVVIATQLAALFGQSKLDRIISSPSLRALRTAQKIAPVIGFDMSSITLDDRLAERNVEPYIGQSINMVFEQPESTLIAGGMEPLAQLNRRTTELAADIQKLTGNTLLVGHSGNIAPLCSAFKVPADFGSKVLRLR